MVKKQNSNKGGLRIGAGRKIGTKRGVQTLKAIRIPKDTYDLIKKYKNKSTFDHFFKLLLSFYPEELKQK